MASARLNQRRGASIQRPKASLSCVFFLVLIGTLLFGIVHLTQTAFDAKASTGVLWSLHAPIQVSISGSSKSKSAALLESVQHISTKENPVTVAYAISLIKCSDFQSSTAGMIDASLVLRHSVHQTSVRNPASGSRYDYKMYVLVHEQAKNCVQPFADAGFTVVIKPQPVHESEIMGAYLRKSIQKDGCCGAAEFVKLYAYTLPELIVVHMDIDFAMFKPMDDLFDVILDDPHQEDAKRRIPLERPLTAWPKKVEAFMTRDWPQVMPGGKAGYQAGFIVLKPNKQVFDEIVELIKEGNYVEGFQQENGWGGLGYGGFFGSMSMQGLLAYYYDVKRPDSWMELNQCRFNHLGMDVLYRTWPTFRPGHAKRGKCRNDLAYCEDCMLTNVTDIYNIHYAMCRKPWNCIGENSANVKGENTVPIPQVDYNHCMVLETLWHDYRTDLERKLLSLTGDKTIGSGQQGDYKKDIFQGHCDANTKYSQFAASPETFKRIPDLYE